jgi:hypothetical protein
MVTVEQAPYVFYDDSGGHYFTDFTAIRASAYEDCELVFRPTIGRVALIGQGGQAVPGPANDVALAFGKKAPSLGAAPNELQIRADGSWRVTVPVHVGAGDVPVEHPTVFSATSTAAGVAKHRVRIEADGHVTFEVPATSSDVHPPFAFSTDHPLLPLAPTAPSGYSAFIDAAATLHSLVVVRVHGRLQAGALQTKTVPAAGVGSAAESARSLTVVASTPSTPGGLRYRTTSNNSVTLWAT